MLPTFICGWDGKALKARVAFGVARARSRILSYNYDDVWALTGLKFNYANIIAFPVLLGVGVALKICVALIIFAWSVGLSFGRFSSFQPLGCVTFAPTGNSPPVQDFTRPTHSMPLTGDARDNPGKGGNIERIIRKPLSLGHIRESRH
jgi:hypothetical protein